MGKNNQKIMLIIIVSLLIITSILAIYFSFNTSTPSAPSEDPSSKEPVISKEITRLKDANTFFSLQNAMNYFYDLREQNSAKELLELLNEDYKYSHNITENNVLTNIVLDNESVSFNVEEAYYNADSDITYYFLKGYIIGESFLDAATYNDNIYFLIIVDVDDNYVVMPLNNINNLEEYAKNYQIENLDINNNSQFEIVKLDDKNKISNYINKFSDLMFLDSNKAYNMLDVKTKAVYPNIDDFNNNINNIYQNIKTKFNYFEKEEYEDNINYNVQTRDNDGNTISISIIEYYPYDYKIGFNFLDNY